MNRPYATYAPPLSAQQPLSRTTMSAYSTSSLPHRTYNPSAQQPPQAQQQQQQQQQQTASAGGGGYMRQSTAFGFGNAGSLGNGMALRAGESVHDASQLDLNDFPALGAVSTPGPNPSSASAQQSTIQGQSVRDGLSSYASQAQAQLHSSASATGAGPGAGNGLNRDFTNPDDFPALGGSTGGQTNGFGGQIGSGSGPISILRNNAFGGEDKRIYGLKQATPTPSSWAQAQHQQQQPPHPPNGISQSQAQVQQQGQGAQAGQDNASALDPASTTNANQLVQPHTPADQVLHSAADRWGLLALVRALRQQTDDALSSGQDLGLLGMELDNPGSLYPKFATPWASYLTTTSQTEPNYHLPSCYNVAPPPPNPKKAAQFSDETLFFSFYAMPRDAAQEVAAQELYNRNWRYHKVQRIWITTDLTTSANSSQQQPNPNNGSNNAASLSNLNLGMSADGSSLCTVWDVETWERQTRMMRIDVRDLENRDAAVANNVAAGSGGLTTMGSAGNVGPMGAGQGNAVGAVGDRSQGQGQGLGLAQQSLSGQGHAQAQAYQQQQQQQQLRV